MTVKKITIAEIPDLLYEGYYWYSNRKCPEILATEARIDKNLFTQMPFVIEANFYAKGEDISIKVNFLNGAYHVAQFNLADLSSKLKTEQVYLGHDLEGKNFKLIEAWQEVNDPNLENMKTLQPAWSAFAGFTDKMP